MASDNCLLLPGSKIQVPPSKRGYGAFLLTEQCLPRVHVIIATQGFKRVWILCWEAVGRLSHLPKVDKLLGAEGMLLN